MNTLSVQLVASLVGKAKGVSGNPGLNRVLNGRVFNAALGITGTTTTGATYADNGFDAALTLATTATTVLDVRSFTNVLNEPTQALSKLRMFYVQHAANSPSASISVGNSGAAALIPLGCMGTTPVTLPPGALLLMAIPSAALAVTVNATAKDVKIANNGTTVASYTVGWWGED